jgi:biotin operon repressor
MNLSTLTSAVTPALRARIHARIWDTLQLPADTADAVLNLVLAEMAAFIPPKRAARDPIVQAQRREVLLGMIRAGHPLAAVARALDLSYPSVSKLIAEARADGCDIPASLPRGRRPAGAGRSSEVIPLLQQGYTREEVALRLTMTARDVDHAAKRARQQGAVVPSMPEVHKWRQQLDDVTAEAMRVARALKARSFEDYASTPEKAAEMEVEMTQQWHDLREQVEALEAAMPAGVTSAPSRDYRRDVATRRKEAAVQRSAGLDRPRSSQPPAAAPKPAANALAATSQPKPVSSTLGTPQDLLAIMQTGLARKHTPAPATPSLLDNYYPEAAKQERDRAEYIAAELASLELKTPEGRRVLLEWADDDVYAAAAERWPGTVPQRGPSQDD